MGKSQELDTPDRPGPSTGERLAGALLDTRAVIQILVVLALLGGVRLVGPDRVQTVVDDIFASKAVTRTVAAAQAAWKYAGDVTDHGEDALDGELKRVASGNGRPRRSIGTVLNDGVRYVGSMITDVEFRLFRRRPSPPASSPEPPASSSATSK